MIVAVTGASGFIGRHVVKQLIENGHKVLAVGTNLGKLISLYSEYKDVDILVLDFYKEIDKKSLIKIVECDKLIHLAWSGLPNYNSIEHFENNVMPQYFFLKKLICLGLQEIIVSGTCLEYGMINGCLTTDMITNPQNPYALAKDTLRKFLERLSQYKPYNLKWVRLFYMYGPGQSSSSILSLLDSALERGDKSFNLSKGEQLRDYMTVEEVASKLVKISIEIQYSGIFNCCSGKPISIRSLVENHLKIKNKKIEFNFGYYTYSELEPLAFWGQPSV